MKPGVKYTLFVVLAILVLAGAIVTYKYLTSVNPAPPSPSDRSSTPSANGATGDPGQRNTAPGFTVMNGEGEDVRLEDYLGKPILLNFWATWCPPCRGELPAFETMSKRYGNEVVFMMIDLTDGYRETPKNVQRFLSEHGYTFPVYYDAKGNAAKAYHVSSIPFTVAIDKNGNVHKTHLGAVNEKTLEALIQSLLDVK